MDHLKTPNGSVWPTLLALVFIWLTKGPTWPLWTPFGLSFRFSGSILASAIAKVGSYGHIWAMDVPYDLLWHNRGSIIVP